jgi:conjugal transfer pilus assembly protein TraB
MNLNRFNPFRRNQNQQGNPPPANDSLWAKYQAMSPAGKTLAKGLTILAVLIFLYGVYTALSSKPRVTITERETTLVNKPLVDQKDEELSERIAIDRQIQEIKTRLSIEVEALRGDNERLREELRQLNSNLRAQIQSQASGTTTAMPPYPLPPSGEGGVSAPTPTPPSQVRMEAVGGIKKITAPIQTIPQSAQTPAGKKNYFPTATLMKGVLLNGLYAPTLSKGSSNPHPAIIRIDDLSSLPNELQRNIEGCRILGEAYGELSDNRVHIRLAKLACTTKDGNSYLDDTIKGVVFGEDGIIGIPGELRANFNELLLTSFFMESLAGLGNAIRGATTTTVISDTGVSQEYVEGEGNWDKAGKIMLAAGGEGLGKGFSLISEFYLNILNEMSPVIKINGGREIEITITDGIELRLQSNEWTWEDLL